MNFFDFRAEIFQHVAKWIDGKFFRAEIFYFRGILQNSFVFGCFFLSLGIDERASEALRSEDAEVQHMVMERGNFEDCRNSVEANFKM